MNPVTPGSASTLTRTSLTPSSSSTMIWQLLPTANMLITSILAESLDASICIIEAKDRVLPQFSPQTSAGYGKH